MKSLKNILLVLVVYSFASSILYAQSPVATGLYSLPFQSRAEIEDFLHNAKIVKDKSLGTGVTNPHKFTLDNGKVQAFAVWKNIDEHRFGVTQLGGPGGPEVDFKDSWKFEVAAYELDKLLGLDMVPPTVERTYKGTKGSLQIWVPNCMTEGERMQKQLNPPDPILWKQQTSKVRVFDALVYNIDRNQGNLLIDPTWKIYMIDHSRTFKNLDALKSSIQLTYFSRSLMDAIQKLDKTALVQHCGKYLMSTEIDNLLKRRDLLEQAYQKLTSQQSNNSISFP
jgi:hypothetical protein